MCKLLVFYLEENMKYILGTKIGMTQKFTEEGVVVPVTVVKAGPCTVVQVKSQEKDGYSAVQVGFGKKNKTNKPMKGHLKGDVIFKYLKEFRDDQQLNVGDVIRVNTFENGDTVKVVATSKGRGFQGVVKRHGFAGMPASHGTKDQVRMPGSIGATGPAHVFKGQRMPGRMGADQVTVAGLEIISIDEAEGLLYIKGAIPGPKNGLVMVKADGELKVNIDITPAVEEKVENDNTPEAAEATDTKENAEVSVDEPKKEDKPEAKEETSEATKADGDNETSEK